MVQHGPCAMATLPRATNQVVVLDDADLDSVPTIRQHPHVVWSHDVHVVGRNVLSCVKLFMHLFPEGRPSGPAYEIHGYGQLRIAQKLILHG